MLSCWGRTINESWENAMRSFLSAHTLSIYEGRETAIVHNMLVHIEDPTPNTEPSDLCLWTEVLKEQYIRAVDYPGASLEINRLFIPFEYGKNQYDLLLHTLSNRVTDRPVYATLNNPMLDLAPNRPLPCLTSIEFQKTQRMLDIKAFYSVLNLYTHGLLDMNQIAYMHTKICRQLSCAKGSLTLYISHSVMNAVDCLICREVIMRDVSDQ
jgi:hypothetical protein